MGSRPAAYVNKQNGTEGITIDMRVFAPHGTPLEDILGEMVESFCELVDKVGDKWRTPDQSPS